MRERWGAASWSIHPNHCSFLFHYIPDYSVAEIESEHVSGPSQSTHSIPSHWLPFGSTEKEIEKDCDNLTILLFLDNVIAWQLFCLFVILFALVSNFIIKITTYLSNVLIFYNHFWHSFSCSFVKVVKAEPSVVAVLTASTAIKLLRCFFF